MKILVPLVILAALLVSCATTNKVATRTVYCDCCGQVFATYPVSERPQVFQRLRSEGRLLDVAFADGKKYFCDSGCQTNYKKGVRYTKPKTVVQRPQTNRYRSSSAGSQAYNWNLNPNGFSNAQNSIMGAASNISSGSMLPSPVSPNQRSNRQGYIPSQYDVYNNTGQQVGTLKRSGFLPGYGHSGF